ncbi:helix-turn-helix transcriptional regulator [Pseudomonas hefeiensis]|uniref:Helix-turn-helix transcriptional regulator n=1 Tax=Pseudomonas hefeiensis TaxID=2738125 RepID=A0ABY9GIT3_9PSED|nr:MULTISPECIES: helix-turn-helix transcriptional regulator [unclassified Pseudomonas]WLH15461.1 helix-turn-helix transcriptional regulator [Pseudomonas sp. FP205]WLH98508.1 helix-turn-helix transcriptional regulator [Pseudomonas sp. FP53]WLI42770.1 helix-turn-helix transcriptional regulator [Pseudomonas sp. FP821]
MREYFSANLKQLCRYYRSIAEVCRKLSINRGQFNKYLSGQSFPAAFNLKRICDFFGVEEYEIVLPTDQFINLIGGRARQTASSIQMAAPQRALEHLKQCSSPQIRLLTGYYHEYCYAMSNPGHISCSLVHIHERDGYFVYERNERSQSNIPGVEDFECYRYQGVAYYLQDRLFLVDYETHTSNEISQTILIPSYKSRITRLNGLKMGVSTCDHRAPVCTRVVWDFLGADIGHYSAYRRVRLYPVDTEEVDDDLKGRLRQTKMVNGLFELI